MFSILILTLLLTALNMKSIFANEGGFSESDTESDEGNDGNSSSELSSPPLSHGTHHDKVQCHNPYEFPKYPMMVLTDTNHVVLRGEITEKLISQAIVALNDVDENTKDIVIYITSPGGSVLAGNNFIQYMNFLRQKGKRLIGIADQAASMAFSIFQECDVRYVTPSSILMQHQMSVGVQDQYENLKNRLKLMEALSRDSTKRQAARIGISEEEFDARVLSDWWIYGADNVVENTADAVVQVGCSRSLLEETVQETVRVLFMTADLVFSKCPLSRAPLEIAVHGKSKPQDVEKFRDDWLNQQSVRLYL